MDIDDAIEYVRTHHHAVLATLKKDGSPQLSPVTAGVDAEGRVIISTRQTAYKVRHVRRDPRVWLCAFPDGFYGRWAQLEGTARSWSCRRPWTAWSPTTGDISGEHPDWDDYRAAMEREQRVLLRVSVTKAGPNVSG